MEFQSKGMQWGTAYMLENGLKKQGKKIGYFNPEEKIEKEDLNVLLDSKELLIVESQKGIIYFFENN